MKVAFLTDIVTPYGVAVLEALGRRCDLTVLFASESGTRGLAWQFDGGLPFRHELIGGLTVRRSSPDATDFYLSPRVVAALRRARPDAIISGGYSFPSLYAAAYAQTARVPLLIHSDGTHDSEARLRPEQRLARRVVVRLAWGAVGNSEPASRRLVEIGFRPERVFRALHATRLEPLWHVGERRNARRAGPLRVLTVGRLIPRKGIDLLLRAVARAAASGTAVDLTVVGSGPEEGRLRTLAGDLGLAPRWHGFVDQPGLPELYADADVFAFPTLDDPFGIVVLEAAAAGLPVIASPHGGATEDFVRDGINGLVVEPRDTAALAAAIGRLADDGELRAAMSDAAYTSSRTRTPEATAAGYVDALAAAVAVA